MRVLSLGLLLSGEAWSQRGPSPPAAHGGPAASPPAAASATEGVVPAAVIASARAAVEKLGNEVARGNHAVAIERMNPQWKERLAKQTPGGMAEVQKQIESASKRMMESGVSIISSVPYGTARAFEVGPGKKVEKVNGEVVETQIFSKWLVLVPTLTKIRWLLEGEPKPVLIEKASYQVAVTEKGKNDWTFIDGSGLSLNTLRRLYVTLPQDLELPVVENRKAADPR